MRNGKNCVKECKTIFCLNLLIRSRLGFYGIFGTCGLLNLLNVVYLMQFVKESLTKKASPEVTVEKSLSFWALVKDFFDWTHIRLTIEFAFAHVGNRRLHLFVLSLLMLFTAGPIFGELIKLHLIVIMRGVIIHGQCVFLQASLISCTCSCGESFIGTSENTVCT